MSISTNVIDPLKAYTVFLKSRRRKRQLAVASFGQSASCGYVTRAAPSIDGYQPSDGSRFPIFIVAADVVWGSTFCKR